MIVKVCGMREPENIRAVEQTGADWMGFICYEGSSRYVADLPRYLPRQAKRVGIFVNADIDNIRSHAQKFQFDYLQLHGTESPDTCQTLHEEGFRLIKAFALRSIADLRQIPPYAPSCDYLLFDTPCTGFGGSGTAFDWDLLRHYEGSTPFLLSGGIRPESLEALKRFRHPRWAGIDLNSGFETAPAVKDAPKLKAFIEAVRKAMNIETQISVFQKTTLNY